MISSGFSSTAGYFSFNPTSSEVAGWFNIYFLCETAHAELHDCREQWTVERLHSLCLITCLSTPRANGISGGGHYHPNRHIFATFYARTQWFSGILAAAFNQESIKNFKAPLTAGSGTSSSLKKRVCRVVPVWGSPATTPAPRLRASSLCLLHYLIYLPCIPYDDTILTQLIVVLTVPLFLSGGKRPRRLLPPR